MDHEKWSLHEQKNVAGIVEGPIESTVLRCAFFIELSPAPVHSLYLVCIGFCWVPY